MMQLLEGADPTALSYWLNWRVLLCALWVFTSMTIAVYLIRKYECLGNSESDTSVPCYDDLWKPCLKWIHPLLWMFFRIIAFCLAFVALSVDVAIHGFELFFYYTQWTFTLVIIYFGMGSLLSMHGCFRHFKTNSNANSNLSVDMEQGLNVPLVNGNGVGLSERFRKCHAFLTPDFWAYVFQALYQMTAGAVVLTDVIYWCCIFPFMTLRDYDMNFLTVVTHTLNAVLLLGDTALNRLPFPWFRISYFIMFTGFYVILQWIIHACVPLWWPYPFLDLSELYSPLWYLLVAVMHLPSYGLYLLVVKLKQLMLSRWSPDSCP